MTVSMKCWNFFTHSMQVEFRTIGMAWDIKPKAYVER
jgi:hypothetical protein